MDLGEYLLKLVLSLAAVLAALFLLLPLLARKLMGIRGSGGKGSFEIRKVSPVAKNVFIVELDVKGKTVLLCVSEKGADVIYREDDRDHPPPAASGSDSSGSGAGDPPR